MKKEKDYHIFVLTGNKRPVSLTLQSKDNKSRRLLGPSKDNSNSRTRPMRYLENHDSPFIDEQNLKQGEEGMLRDIVFEDGQLIVYAHQKNLYNFLKLHPDYEKKYEEFDPVKEMQNNVDFRILRNKAENFVVSNFTKPGDFDLIKDMVSVLDEVNVDDMSSAEIKHRALGLADNDPQGVIRYSNSDKLGFSMIARKALQDKFVSRKKGNVPPTLILSETGEEICKILEDDKEYVKSLELAMMEDVNLYKKIKEFVKDA